jgi:hypothetical protein
MSVSTVIVSIYGRLAGSKDSSTTSSCCRADGISAPDEATASGCDPFPAGSVLGSVSDSLFSRAQRETKFSGEVILSPSLLVLASGQRLLRRLASALDEGPLDVVFGEKLNNSFYGFGGHWHRFD